MADDNFLLLRVEKLEGSNRRLKLLAIGPLLAFGVLLVSGQAGTSRSLKAEEFVVVDKDGTQLARLGSSQNRDGACLNLAHGKDTDSVLICPASGKTDGGLVSLDGPAGGQAVHILAYSAKLEGPELSLNTPNLSEAIVLDVSKKPPLLASMSPIKGGSVFIGVDEMNATLRLGDNQRFSAILGNSSLVTESKGEEHRRSAASLLLSGKDGKVLWSAP